MEVMVLEFADEVAFICLLELNPGDRNTSFNLAKNLEVVDEGDPVLGTMTKMKTIISKVSAIIMLSKSISNLNSRKKKRDVETINLLKNDIDESKKVQKQVKKAVGKTSVEEPKGKGINLLEKFKKMGVEVEPFNVTESFGELFPEVLGRRSGENKFLSSEDDVVKSKKVSELDDIPATVE
jgi:hypothetical protein